MTIKLHNESVEKGDKQKLNQKALVRVHIPANSCTQTDRHTHTTIDGQIDQSHDQLQFTSFHLEIVTR